MASRKRRNAATQIEALHEYLDRAEWMGFFPSPRSSDPHERKWGFWMNRMRAAKAGMGHNLWYPQIEVMAAKRGYPDLFTTDFRILGRRHFDFGSVLLTLPASKMAPHFPVTHTYESGEGPVFNVRVRTKALWSGPYGETLWLCTDGEIVHPFSAFHILSEMAEFKCESNFIDMKGQQFGRWTVMGYANQAADNNEVVWFCFCSCGSIEKVRGSQLRLRRSTSCGCSRQDKVVQVATIS